MAHRSLQFWRNRTKQRTLYDGKQGTWQQHMRPYLEFLESRCLPSTVTNLNDSGAGSLRQAIIDTPAGGTVDFQAGLSGTVTLTSGELLVDHDMNIAGPGADVITISGNHMSRVFEISAKFTVEISQLSIVDGSGPGGGGIENAGVLTLSNLNVSDNSAPNFGGGIHNSGSLTIAYSSVSRNSASQSGRDTQGGGIYNSGYLTFAYSTLSGNSAMDNTGPQGFSNSAGGGIYNSGSLTIAYSTLSGNSASDQGLAMGKSALGGGIYNIGLLTVSYSTLVSNSATAVGRGTVAVGDGGGIYNSGSGTGTISYCTVSGNFANNGGASGGASAGGGIANLAMLAVTNSTVSGNVVMGNGTLTGAGIYNSGMLTVTNSTLSRNSADNGGGIVSVGTMNVANTIIGRNSATALPDINGVVTSLGHNLIGDGTGGSGYDATDLVGTSDNPIDPLLDRLADNGGPTQTMALRPGSPAIGAGDPTNAPEFDQRGPGFPRVVNGRIDIGAFEVQENPNPENPIHGGFDAFTLPPCDDCSSPATSLGFTFNFFGVRRDTVWVNNNGNLTFDSAFGSFLPGPVDGVGQPILAPFWADVYTNGTGLGRVTYGRGTLDGDPAFAATWENVAHYLPDGTVSYFQVVLIDHSERGFQEVQFNYLTIGWDHTDSSDLAPRVGYTNAAGASAELPGSGTFDTLVDSGAHSLRLLRRYTLIVYPFTVAGGFTGDFVHFSASGSGNQPTSIPLVAFGAIDERVAVPNLQSTTATSAAASSSPPSNRVSWPTILPRLEAVSAPDATALLDLVLADDRLLM